MILGTERHGELRPEPLDPGRGDAMSCGDPQHVPIDDEECAAVRAANPDAAPGDPVEDGLRVSRRGADDPQDLRRGRLLLQALSQARLKLASAGGRSLGFGLRLRGLGAPTHSS